MTDTKNRALVWEDIGAVMEPTRRYAERPAAQTRWARQPWQGRLGRYVAVRLRGAELEVGVAGSPHITWVPAQRAIGERDAAKWVAEAF